MVPSDREYMLGLVGRRLDYSFSRSFFHQFFQMQGISTLSYHNFEISELNQIENVFAISNLVGLNVTIPYKERIISCLDQIQEPADHIRSVNCVVKHPKKGIWIGYNTDWLGAKASLHQLLGPKRRLKKVLILGTGATARTYHYVLSTYFEVEQIWFVSRSPNGEHPSVMGYEEVSAHLVDVELVINTTPLGTYPNVEEKPPLPYEGFHANLHLLDVVYNPETSAFLREGGKRGIPGLNGKLMLEIQAYASWSIWNSYYRWI